MHKVVILGGSFAGNKGAASMVRAVIDGTRARWGEVDVCVLTPLPEEDRRFVGAGDEVGLVPFGPVDILAAVLVALVYRLSGRRVGRRNRAVDVLARSGVAVDVSGISFVDGRGPLTLAYNVLLMVVPLLVGCPVVKVAQAMGPFRGTMNRLAARQVLSRIRWIAARGAQTAEHLRALGVDNWEPAHDVAFLMEVTQDHESWAQEVVDDRPVAVVAPSMVVEDRRDAEGYRELMTSVVDQLTARYEVLLVPHAARPGRPPGRLNDLPLCHSIQEGARTPDRCRVVGPDAGPGDLRALIGHAEVLITSRFHAMISGLAVGTPVLVVGWSHKYREVLDDFGLSEWTTDFRRASEDRVLHDLARLVGAASEVRARIKQELPRVIRHAAVNIDLIERVLEGDDL